MTTRSFIVPVANQSIVEQKIEKLNKRALKLKLEPVSITWGKAFLEQDKLCLPCELTGPFQVSYDGWEFIATLQHLPTGENIIRAITNDYEIPLQYRTSGSACEHCNVKRYRKDTYVVRHDATCEALQVGSSCIKDFLGGNSPDNILQQAALVGELISFMEGARHNNFENNEGIYYLNHVLAQAAACIRECGWMSKTEAKETGKLATATVVEYNLLQDSTYGLFPVSIEDRELAEQAINWVENLSDEEVENSDYLYNIRAIARSGMVGVRTIGYTVSIISSYLRQVKQLQFKKESQFVGLINDRSVFTLNLKKVTGFSGNYGWTNKYIFHDPAGNILVWLTSTSKDLQEGQQYQIKATVKAHQEFKSIKETILTRCEIL